MISGLVLVVLLRPPLRPQVGADGRSGDPRPAVLCLVLLLLVFATSSIPLADQLFGLTPLRQTMDYLIVGVAVLAWALTTVLAWRVAPLQRLWQPLRG